MSQHDALDRKFLSDKAIPERERLIMALDVPDIAAARDLVERLDDAICFYKVGLELFMSGDAFDFISWLRDRDAKIFVDLKFFDVPQTVASAVRNLAQTGATFTTVHGNDGILAAASAAKGSVKLLAVTVLTSLDQGDIEALGFDTDVRALVLSRAQRALQAGCDGVVSSGLEVRKLREQVGHELIVVVPGIRPVMNRPLDDQKRTVDVEDAFLNGADYIVVGRPIRDATDPHAAAEAIQRRISNVFVAQ